jgi:hypothetical protein
MHRALVDRFAFDDFFTATRSRIGSSTRQKSASRHSASSNRSYESSAFDSDRFRQTIGRCWKVCHRLRCEAFHAGTLRRTILAQAVAVPTRKTISPNSGAGGHDDGRLKDGRGSVGPNRIGALSRSRPIVDRHSRGHRRCAASTIPDQFDACVRFSALRRAQVLAAKAPDCSLRWRWRALFVSWEPDVVCSLRAYGDSFGFALKQNHSGTTH